MLKVDYEKQIPLNKIENKAFDVRRVAGAADQPRVDLLSGLYKDGKVTDHIDVTPPNAKGIYRLVDGRTRYAALTQNKVKTTKVRVLKEATEPEYIEHAYLCNSKGAKPPELEDLKTTVEALLRRGMKPKDILSGPLAQVESQNRLKLACDQVRSNLNKQGVARAKVQFATPAIQAITNPEERFIAVAQQNNVSVRAVKKALTNAVGVRKNTFLNEVKKDLGRTQNKRRTWLKDWVYRIEGRHDDGAPTNQIFEVYEHIIKQLQSNLNVMTEAKERFSMRVNGGKVRAAKAA
jgi:hypothetical protein